MAVSREVAPLAVLAAAMLVLVMAGPRLASGLARGMAVLLEQAHALEPVAALKMALLQVVLGAAPVVLAVLAAGVAAVVLQTGPLFNLAKLLPDASRLDPRRGLRRVFGTGTLIDAGKSVLKMAVVAWVGWRALVEILPQLQRSMAMEAATLGGEIARQVVAITAAMLVAQAGIAVIDVLLTRLRHARSLRMSKQELREEHKDLEGDPHIKQRIKRIRLARARKRMIAAVPQATVVIVNPTHYAVALAYDQGETGKRTARAPRVVAKGVDELAARIREIAERNRVPVVPSPPLARALYQVELDAEIPAEHFKAVAEIIAFVWRMRGKLVADRVAASGPDRAA